MAWEKRARRSYFYRSVRRGARSKRFTTALARWASLPPRWTPCGGRTPGRKTGHRPSRSRVSGSAKPGVRLSSNLSITHRGLLVGRGISPLLTPPMEGLDPWPRISL